MRTLAFLPAAMGPVAALQKAELVVDFMLGPDIRLSPVSAMDARLSL
jgi:hypothetical protein